MKSKSPKKSISIAFWIAITIIAAETAAIYETVRPFGIGEEVELFCWGETILTESLNKNGYEFLFLDVIEMRILSPNEPNRVQHSHHAHIILRLGQINSLQALDNREKIIDILKTGQLLRIEGEVTEPPVPKGISAKQELSNKHWGEKSIMTFDVRYIYY